MTTTARLLLFAALLGLSACSLMPLRMETGTPRAEIERRLGAPTAVIALADGQRLQYSRQPSGQEVYNLDLGPDGRLRRVEQVMDASWLQQNIAVDRWTRDDALRHLGRPALVERVMSFEGDVWTYRYLEATRPRQVHLHIDRAGVVRKLAFTDEPGYADDPGATHP